MTNPYESPRSHMTETSTVGLRDWSRAQWITAAGCVVAIVVLTIASVVLFKQASRLKTEGDGLPARFQMESAATVRPSWIGGLAGMAGAVLAAIALVLVSKKKLAAAVTLMAITGIGIVAIAIMFKPS